MTMRARADGWSLWLLGLAFAAAPVGAAGCNARDARPAPGASGAQTASGAGEVTVTLLYTTDEHGWLLPHRDNKGMLLGGAAEMLGTWIATEHHCRERASGSAATDPTECAAPPTLLLSGGDSFTGPAISTYFRGEPMAQAMARMGYAAAAFGNHDFDFGRDAFVRNRATSHVRYLAANVHAKSAAAEEAAMPAFAAFERLGVRIGVVGLATDTTLATAMASRFEGIEFEAEEPALERAVPEAWNAGVDAVVVIAHECPDVLEPIIARHPDWRLAFVGAGHCHKHVEARAGAVPIVAPGWRLEAYARVHLRVDRRRPPRERVVSTDVEVVDVGRPESQPPAHAPDAPLAALIARYVPELDKALGERIGYSRGLEQASPELARWVAEAWRRELGTDVAIVNSGGIRQGVPKGPITLNTIYSVMPFDNRLVVCRLDGGALVENLNNPDAIATGASKSSGGWVDARGNPIRSGASYTVATIDFLYLGGASFTFRKYDPAPKGTGLDWRTPVIEWTKKQQTSEAHPIEDALVKQLPRGAAEPARSR